MAAPVKAYATSSLLFRGSRSSSAANNQDDAAATDSVPIAQLPASIQTLLGPLERKGGQLRVSEFMEAASLYAESHKKRTQSAFWCTCSAAVILIALLLGIVWAVVAASKDSETTTDGALTAAKSGKLVTVNTRLSKELLPVTSFLPKSRVLDLQHMSVSDSLGNQAALRVVGVMTSHNATGYPGVTVVTEVGDVILSGSAASADWAAISTSLGLLQPVAPPVKIGGTFVRANPAVNGGDYAYQQAVAQCEFATSGAPLVPEGGAGSAAHKAACEAQAQYERGRTAALLAGGEVR